MRLICNRTQNDVIWELIALFLTNQIAGNTIDFKMNVIKYAKHIQKRKTRKREQLKNIESMK